MPLSRGRSFVILGLGLAALPASAAYTAENYRDVRWLGRGNAGVAVAAGGASAFYNPAGLADTQDVSFNLLDFSLGTNNHAINSVQEISTLTSSGTTLGEKFQPLLGKPMALQGSFFPHIQVPGFLLGYYNYLSVDVEYRNPVYPELGLDARRDWGIVLGAATHWRKKVFFGASLRYVKRTTLDEKLTAASIFDLDASYLRTLMITGDAWAINAGVKVKESIGANGWAALGLAVEDLGQTRFKNNDLDALAPEPQNMKINVGTAYGMKAGGSAEVALLFDIRRVNERNESYSKKLYMGTEAGIGWIMARAGLYQGYWTLGLTTDIGIGMLDVATYGEELGAAAGQRGSRVYVAGLRMGLDGVFGKRSKPRKKQQQILDRY
jgi:hypothetical protein